MQEKASRELGEVIKTLSSLQAEYRRRVERVKELARRLSYNDDLGVYIVGFVSSVEEGEANLIPVDVPPTVWVRLAHRLPQAFSPGFYYCVADPKSMILVLATVSDVVRTSGVQALGARLPPIYPPVEEENTLSYNIVSIRLLLRPMAAVKLGEGGLGQPVSPNTPPDPGSPVFVPKPDVIQGLIGGGGRGVTIGVLGVMDQPYIPSEPVAVKLPWSVLVKHVLVTGTTGSGKTSLVKNVLYDAVRGGANALVLDANGDYVAGLFPGYIPAGRVTERVVGALRAYGVDAEPGREVVSGGGLDGLVVVPCPRREEKVCDDEEAGRVVKEYARRLRALAESMYARLRGEDGCRVSVRSVDRLEPYLYRVVLDIDCKPVSGDVNVLVAPRCVSIGGRVELLGMLDPYMTPRAREELPRIYQAYLRERGGGGGFDDFVAWVTGNTTNIIRELRVHKETLAALQRRLIVLRNSGLIDSGAPGIDYGSLLTLAARYTGGRARTVILDLEYAAAKTPEGVPPQMVKVFLGYQALRSLALRPPEGYTLVVIDEAHLFFPSRRGEGRGYQEVLSEQLERLARLGRSRGIAMIFSTHREDDVSQLLVTLANTKIYMRCDRSTAERLRLPREYQQALPFFADHAAVLSSYAVRGGFTTIINAPPVIGHRTV